MDIHHSDPFVYKFRKPQSCDIIQYLRKRFVFKIYLRKVRYNITDINYGFGIWSSWSGTNNSIIENNIIFDSKTGIYLYGSNNNTISNNKAYNNRYNGIHIEKYSINNIIHDNIVHNNSYFYGINLESQSNDNLLYNNTAYNNIYNIALYESHNNTIVNNTIFDAVHDGLYIEGYDTNNTICNNSIVNNTFNDIYIKVCSYDNRIINNTLSGNVKLWNTSRTNYFESNIIPNYLVYDNADIDVVDTMGAYTIRIFDLGKQSIVKLPEKKSAIITNLVTGDTITSPPNSSFYVETGENIRISVHA